MATPLPLQSLLNILHLVRVMDAGSFAEAARRSGTTTSALSKAVTRLEQAHGIKLMHRTTHAISLTPDGEKLIEGARHLLREAEQLQGMLDRTGGGVAGRVRLSAPGPLIRACLSPQLPALLRAHPRIELDLKVDDAQLDLAAEGIDIAIRIGSSDGQPGLVTRKLMSFPWVLCASPSYLQAMGGLASPADLARHHQIGFRDAGSGQLMTWQFTDPDGGGVVRHVPRNRLVVEDMTTIWAMVASGLGTAWLPAWCGLDDLRAGRVVELLRDWRAPETTIHAALLDRRLIPQRARRVLDGLADAAVAWTYRTPRMPRRASDTLTCGDGHAPGSPTT